MRLGFTFRLTVFLIVLIIAISFLFALRIWSSEWSNFLFRADRWLELIFVFAVALALSQIIVKLLQWAARKEL